VLSQKRRISLAGVALAAGVVTAMACGGGGGGGASYGTNPTVTPVATTPTVAAATADVTITINSMSADTSFSPNPGSVKVGQTVAWRNADSIAHTATGSGFDTGLIPAGATSAPITFATAGSIAYHCSVHPSMVGSLSVAS
jgi:plastocyanin